jgi:MFS family permease
MFLLGFALVGVTSGIVGDAGAARLVSVWFHKHRGVVMGIVASSTGIGSTVVCILQTAAIERAGFRASYFLAAILLASCAVIAILFVRSHPAKMGMLPYGDGERIEQKKREHSDHWQGPPMKRLVRRPAFYMMAFGTLISATLPYLAYYVLVPHLQDKGLPFAKASSLQSVLMLALTGAKLMNGYLCDKIGAKKVEIMCILSNIAALVLLATAKSYALLMVAVIVFSVGLTAFSVIIPLLSTTLFGYQAQSAFNGIFFAMISAAGILASPISNAIYSKIGNTYSPIFLVAAGLLVLVMFGYLLMYRLADQDRRAWAAEEE